MRKTGSRAKLFSKTMAFIAATAGAFLAAFVAVQIVAAFTGPSSAPPNGSGVISASGNDIGIGIANPGGVLDVESSASIQTNCGTESASCPTPPGSGYGLVLDSDYTNGTYRWRLQPIDRGANISLYVQEAGGSANAFSNVARFGSNQFDSNAFAVFGNTSISGNLSIGGTISGGTYTGTIGAGNISAGTFGSNTGGGNFTFPGAITVNGTTQSSFGGQVNSTGYCINGANCITSWPSSGTGTVTSVTAGSGLSGGTITTSGTISLNTANANTWTANQTFTGSICLGGVCNSTWPSGGGSGTIGGSGTANYVPLFTAGTTLGNSVITQSGSSITIGGNLSVGSNKITAGTIDPVYTIDGTNYATYVPGMTGQKEETAGTLALAKQADGTWSGTIDFAQSPKGSDLWLFAQATNLKDGMDGLIVNLTPSFNGTVWYTKDAAAGTLTLHAAAAQADAPASLEVSYNLTAPRFDAAQWTNLAPAEDAGTTGFIINTDGE